MGNYLISKKLLEGKLFLFCSPQRRKEYEMKCLLLRLRSLNARGASRHPAFMGNCQTINHTCQPYLSSRWVLLYIFVPGVTKGYESVQYFIVVWCKSRELGGRESPRFPSVTAVVESFSSDLPRAKISYWAESRLESCEISTMESFSKNIQ